MDFHRPTTFEDAAAIAADVPQVSLAAPAVQTQARLIRGNRNWQARVNGTASNYFQIRDWPIAAGRSFSRREEQGAGKVVIIGKSLKERLFDDADPLGEEIRIADVPMTVFNRGRVSANRINDGRIEMADRHLSMFSQDLISGFHPPGRHGRLDVALIEASAITAVPGRSPGIRRARASPGTASASSTGVKPRGSSARKSRRLRTNASPDVKIQTRYCAPVTCRTNADHSCGEPQSKKGWCAERSGRIKCS